MMGILHFRVIYDVYFTFQKYFGPQNAKFKMTAFLIAVNHGYYREIFVL